MFKKSHLLLVKSHLLHEKELDKTKEHKGELCKPTWKWWRSPLRDYFSDVSDSENLESEAVEPIRKKMNLLERISAEQKTELIAKEKVS